MKTPEVKVYSSKEYPKTLPDFMDSTSNEGDICFGLRRTAPLDETFRLQGNHSFVFCALKDGTVVGTGSKTERLSYVNGQLTTTGLLGNLRIDSGFRGSTLLHRGFKALSSVNETSNSEVDYAVVLDDNTRALKVLTPRPAAPSFSRFGTYFTDIIRSNSTAKPRRKFANVGIEDGTNADLEAVSKFLQSEGSKKQFYPYYTRDDLTQKTGRLAGLGLGDILVAYHGREIVGTVALWDQSPLRSWYVKHYSHRLRILRIPYNALAFATGRPALPVPTTEIPYVFLSLVCIKHNDPVVFGLLLAEGLKRLERLDPRKLLVVGLHEDDPLRAALKRLKKYTFRSTLLVANPRKNDCAVGRLRKDLVPFIEIGSI